MNVQTVTIIVTSSDGIDFAVTTTAPSYDRAYAAKTPATALAKNSDFTQVQSLDDLLPASEYFQAPRISSPLDRRAAFRVIKGGKQS